MKYLETLEESQMDFIKKEEGLEGKNSRLNLASFIGNDPQDPLDWKSHLEMYLEEKKDEYFWADELLK